MLGVWERTISFLPSVIRLPQADHWRTFLSGNKFGKKPARVQDSPADGAVVGKRIALKENPSPEKWIY